MRLLSYVLRSEVLVPLALAFAILGLLVLVWLLPDPREWSGLTFKDRMPVATIIIGWLALGAALVAILAAVAEVRHIFPKQTVRVSTAYRNFISPALPVSTYQLIFEIPSGSPIINIGRIYVRLVRSSEKLSDAKWCRQQTCEQKKLGDIVSDETAAIEIPHLQSSRPRRESPFPGTWIASVETFSPPVGTTDLEWVWDFENPWFPSVLVQGPEVRLTGGHSHEYR